MDFDLCSIEQNPTAFLDFARLRIHSGCTVVTIFGQKYRQQLVLPFWGNISFDRSIELYSNDPHSTRHGSKAYIATRKQIVSLLNTKKGGKYTLKNETRNETKPLKTDAFQGKKHRNNMRQLTRFDNQITSKRTIVKS
ncbi:hypothetical protein [Olivibacter sitiensis]|uniref:hypothetical protein n=1 Tax=Olivibacter sitiensis TaxID=376470 RepID=UPI0004844623|nr:hypothetical protein [Olivibacter sitiensis]